MIDCDPQAASLTFWFPPQWDHSAPESRYDLSHVLAGQVSIEQATWPTGISDMDIVPSYKTVGQFETLRPPGADLALRQALDEAQPYDVTLIDCPPNLGLLTVTAVASADEAIIPVLPGGLDMAGVGDLNQTVALVQKRLNHNLKVSAVLLRRIRKTRFGDAVEDQLVADYPEAIFQVIRHTVAIEEAPTAKQTLIDYAPKATATADYHDLALRLDEAAVRKVTR
jgi:chromosome partitioning protein